uniref:THAP-type domain-containing protein n=1 Tax=Denticeps clupeoides TaxID=299321 RepID=A0AAY4A4E4_9TELE
MLPRYYCIAHGCGISQGPYVEEKGITFHRWSQKQDRCPSRTPRWRSRFQSVLCSKHFADDCFDGSGETVTLRQDAVPTVDISPVKNICDLERTRTARRNL